MQLGRWFDAVFERFLLSDSRLDDGLCVLAGLPIGPPADAPAERNVAVALPDAREVFGEGPIEVRRPRRVRGEAGVERALPHR